MNKAYYIDSTDLELIVESEKDDKITYAEKLSLENAIKNLKNQINKTSLEDGNARVDAESIWDDWFSSINADVFISHSSKDGKLAIQFANWLYEKFNLKSFVDSQFWLRIDNLQREFDEKTKFMKIEYDSSGMPSEKAYYDYNKRNESTAHVHALVTYALTKMINKTPVFIFIKSNSSISFEESIEKLTSPWIFHELAIVDLINSQKLKKLEEQSTENDFSNISVTYPMLGNCLKQINYKNLIDLQSAKNKKNLFAELDSLIENHNQSLMNYTRF